MIVRSTIIFILLFTVGCGSDDTEDKTPDVMQTEDSSADTSPSDVASMDTSTEDLRPERDEACDPMVGCQRGLTCVENCFPECTPYCANTQCNEAFGAPGDDGCLLTEGGSTPATPAECEQDSDCEGSPHGSNCIFRVCTDQTPCESDTDCTVPGESCHWVGACAP